MSTEAAVAAPIEASLPIKPRRRPPASYVSLEMPIVEVVKGVEMVGGPGGILVPKRLVKAHQALEDQTVRWCMAFAMELSDQIARFKVHQFDDIFAFLDELAEKFGAKRGGRKGNVTLRSFDDCMRVEIKIQSLVVYGAELSSAKELVDEFIAEQGGGASEQLLALVHHAFQVDSQGKINRSRLVALKQLDIDNPLWRRAMEALSDAERPAGSKAYLRFQRRANPEANWSSVTIDLAAA